MDCGAVYEALLTEARRSSLNVRPDGTRNTVPAFVEALRPYINMDILQHANRATPRAQRNVDPTKKQEGRATATPKL